MYAIVSFTNAHGFPAIHFPTVSPMLNNNTNNQKVQVYIICPSKILSMKFSFVFVMIPGYTINVKHITAERLIKYCQAAFQLFLSLNNNIYIPTTYIKTLFSVDSVVLTTLGFNFGELIVLFIDAFS